MAGGFFASVQFESVQTAIYVVRDTHGFTRGCMDHRPHAMHQHVDVVTYFSCAFLILEAIEAEPERNDFTGRLHCIFGAQRRGGDRRSDVRFGNEVQSIVLDLVDWVVLGMFIRSSVCNQ